MKALPMSLARTLWIIGLGTTLFVGCAIGKVPIERAVLTIWPFYIAILIALVLTTFVPAVSLTLPSMVN